jgi:GxxExxY protein
MERPLSVLYKDVRLDCGYRIDLLVEDEVVVELKSVNELAPIHQAQILTYMKLAEVSTGLLINFNVTILTDGVKRFKL